MLYTKWEMGTSSSIVCGTVVHCGTIFEVSTTFLTVKNIVFLSQLSHMIIIWEYEVI